MKRLVTATLLALAILSADPAAAQQPFNGVRVMIAADDADPNSVVRSSDMYHRLQIPLNEDMRDGGYQVLFEDAMAAELEWEIEDRSSKQRVLSLVKAACVSNKATLCPRVVVLVRTMAAANDLGFGVKANVRMTGEMIDAATNAVLGGFEAPSLDFTAPRNCNSVCIEKLVGDNSRKVAMNLGATLRTMLDRQAFAAPARPQGPVTGRAAAGEPRGLRNVFVIEFERLDMTEVLPLQSEIKAFPGSREVSMPSGGNGFASISLTTNASAGDIQRYLHNLLADRGYNPKNVTVTTAADKFTIQRVVDDGYRPRRSRP